MIRAIIFDAGGVLHQSNKAVSDDFMKELGLSKEQMEAIWRDYIPLIGSGEISEKEFWAKTAKEFHFREVSTKENLLGRAFKSTLINFDLVYKLAEELKSKGFKLAVLSNTIEAHAEILREEGLYSPFEYLFLSHELGMRKPDTHIFRHALQIMEVLPAETIFIDDDPKNVEAAKSIGIHGMVFSGPTELRHEVLQLISDNNE